MLPAVNTYRPATPLQATAVLGPGYVDHFMRVRRRLSRHDDMPADIGLGRRRRDLDTADSMRDLSAKLLLTPSSPNPRPSVM